MPVRHADAEWQGSLKGGAGKLHFGHGQDAYHGKYSWASRFEDAEGTNPEELLGAAHAGCFTLALAAALTNAGHEPLSIETSADVHIERGESGPFIPLIELSTRAIAPGFDPAEFGPLAEQVKVGCPVSRALAGVEIRLTAELAAA